MNNFLNFIKEDVEAKKTLFSTMPTNNKTNIRKFNEKIDETLEKYNEYKDSLNKYLNAKSKSLSVKIEDKGIDKLTERVNNLEHIKFILNPSNTYIEKMGFDNLLYQISNYYDFNFSSLNDIINEFLNKFEFAGILLTEDDFDYTCYVNEYMVAFLDVRRRNSGDYSKVSEIFESIYWLNPDIIQHIELNFRKLIKKYERKFNDYISKLKTEVSMKNNIKDYEDCLEKLKAAYIELNECEEEDASDIIELVKSGRIDITAYFEDSKTRESNFSSMVIEPLDFEDKPSMDKFYEIIKKLKYNIEEYANYVKFIPLFEEFKREYEKEIPKDGTETNKNNVKKNLKDLEDQINDKEAKLYKINRKIFGSKGSSNDSELKQLKIDSVKQAKELYNLYKQQEQEYFKDKVLSVLSSSLTISELLHLYYSFDYFKKMIIKKVFDITNYDEIIRYSESFDLFAMNPTNIIVNGTFVFEENNIGTVIMNKYRLDNINLTEENLNPDELENLLNKIKFLLRVNVIEKSSTSVEKIWFIAQVEKINTVKPKK
jgi:hypothetical protein